MQLLPSQGYVLSFPRGGESFWRVENSSGMPSTWLQGNLLIRKTLPIFVPDLGLMDETKPSLLGRCPSSQSFAGWCEKCHVI